ncbi:hypothetical protein K6837_003942 [Vibrio parahaemolyticus]|nr:hypothetical protein [Vibrio parahaemolyticus]EIA1589980.1 hypothetical protein [Vibrio parahaemolyticus]
MLAFLKEWRKAYLEDKGDRLHAQVEAERNVLCQHSISANDVSSVFHRMNARKKDIDFEQIHRDAVKVFPSSDEHKSMW